MKNTLKEYRNFNFYILKTIELMSIKGGSDDDDPTKPPPDPPPPPPPGP